MAQPSWVTEPGKLGTIPESKFYRVALEATDPDFPSDASKVKFVKLSGNLPSGIQITNNGVLEGTPLASVQGSPNLVSANVTSTFAIRAYTEIEVNGTYVQDRISDRTFSIVVTGQDVPEFTTPSGRIGSFFDGEFVNIQLAFTDTDPDENLTISLSNGALPPGVSVSNTGLISGYIAPASSSTSANVNFENEGWGEFPFEFDPGTISKSYEFTIKISDGTDFTLRTFSIFVGIVTADATAYTADLCSKADSDSCVSAANVASISADSVSRTPYIESYVADLGTHLHNNFFTYEFKGKDFDNDILNYGLINCDSSLYTADSQNLTVDFSSSLPNGLSLNRDSGFIYGTLSNIGLTEQQFSFTIIVYKKDNTVVFSTFDYTIKIIGDINSGVTWTSGSSLGTINNGAVSELSITAVASANNLLYRFKPDVHNHLPQGLSLLSSGNIIGKASFQNFGVVSYSTTADSNTVTVDTNTKITNIQGFEDITFDNNTTTFDKVFNFTVEAYSIDGQVSTFKTFSITLIRKHITPSSDLQINALPSQTDRLLIDSLLQNQDIINQKLLYRPDDPYHGVATRVAYTHAYGLNPESMLSYTEALQLNHYDKSLTLGEIKTARALDDNGNVQYEVVYSTIVDNLVNNKNTSVSNSVQSSAGVVYPNSLSNMRDRIIAKVGNTANLPRWMISEQADGNILGFVPAWIIAYTLPGQSESMRYTINRDFGAKLNTIDFTADRYTLNLQYTKNWNTTSQRWYPTDETTFDIYEHAYSVDSTTITSDNSASGYYASSFDNTSTESTFDDRSCRFISTRSNTADISTKTADTINITADNGQQGTSTAYNITDRFNKYLIFPKKDIINKKQVTI